MQLSPSTSQRDSRIVAPGGGDIVGPVQELPGLDLFDRLSASIRRNACSMQASAVADRLWRLGATVTTFTDEAVTPSSAAAQRSARPLQQRAARLIRELELDNAELQGVRELLCAFAAQGLSLRDWTKADAARYAQLLDDPEVWRYLPESYPNPVTQELADYLIEVANNAPQHHKVWALYHGDSPVGQVRAEWRDFTDAGHNQADDDPVAEISYWLGRDYWTRGFASKAIAQATQQLFAAHPNLREVNARVMPGNRASGRVLEKAGYRPCGILRTDRTDEVFRVFRESYEPLLG